MVEQAPMGRTTYEIVADAKARQDAFTQVESLMAQATGTGHDVDGTIEVTVDARGKLLGLWLAPGAVNWGPDRLGSLIVEVTQVAMREATQNSYNKVALLLGEDMTYLIEQLSGMPAPARAEHDDRGMTVEEFQRRRDERLRTTQRRTPSAPQPDQAEDDDVFSFDPASLRSDR
ncbi:YbaB/EbfC family nucleoid-associated protein [Amycolatopsis cihanbeyliensis]|uniref:YbaB/EbfC DNA-binding family protein n=1 Tax=Amycolatopsis cihanbeyliensis TaxID=1128664 RepID=A0A542DQ64_AMYCI|nr:YbaB/EbfC family nucleoid-associated protein [Amycolatopsis cihanbeyliensis]TQJ05196.1 YbaB/EbfC DNA-binding family protein [Amycolatopsis cihanbeyliensis]